MKIAGGTIRAIQFNFNLSFFAQHELSNRELELLLCYAEKSTGMNQLMWKQTSRNDSHYFPIQVPFKNHI